MQRAWVQFPGPQIRRVGTEERKEGKKGGKKAGKEGKNRKKERKQFLG